MSLFQSPTLITEMKLKLDHVHNWDDQRWDSNSWSTTHIIGDILFSIQLLITYLVTTFCVGDNHEILGICFACGPKQQNGHSFSLWMLWLSVGSNRARNHSHFVSRNHSPSPHISHDYRDDHRLKMSRLTKSWLHTMSPSKWCSQQLLGLTSDHHSKARDTDIILFQRKFVKTMSVTFCRINHSKKNHDIVTGQALVAKIPRSMHWSYQSFWVSPFIITIEYVTLTWILFHSDFLSHWL